MSRPPIRAVQDLIAWQRAVDLAEAVFLLVQKIPWRSGFALSEQARRTAVSIPANLAEGRGRLLAGLHRALIAKLPPT